nr:unnamed protein product [Digitaria exilis]
MRGEKIALEGLYSIVCDLSNNESIDRLRRVKGIGDSKARLSFIRAINLSASFVAHYVISIPTQQDFLEYTFILPATKQFPKQLIKHGSSTSVKYLSEDEWILDPVIIADLYEPLGLDFIVDGGPRIADPSTVVDMTGTNPTIIRQGKGPKLDWMVAKDEEEEQSMFTFKAA